jgi:protein-L-isoaspartate(D-aspartate) O-methyltransferase
VAAAAAELPVALLQQLAPGGRLVLPLGRELVRVTDADGHLRMERLAPVRFVPLVAGLPG